MQASCLIDFFNLDLWTRSRQPHYGDIRAGLEEVVQVSLEAITSSGAKADDLAIRLYGGWYGDTITTRVPMRELTSAVVRDFPSRVGARVRIELAETPIWDRSLRLLRTLRDVPLKPPSRRIAAPSHCGNAANCTVSVLAEWMRGRCPASGCGVAFGELGATTRQKMVDTLIIADALSIQQARLADILIVAGDDDDLIPALLAIGSGGVKGIRIKRRSGGHSYYDGILELQGVHTHLW